MFGRIAAWSARHARAVAGRHRAGRRGRGVRRPAPRHRRRHRHPRRPRLADLPGDRALPAPVRRRRGGGAGRGRPAQARPDRQPRPAAAPRGLPVGQRARRTSSRCPGACTEIAEMQPGEGRLRARHLPQPGGARDPGRARRPDPADPGDRRPAPRRAAARQAAAAGPLEGRAAARRRRPPRRRSASSSRRGCCASRPSTGSPACRRSTIPLFVSQVVFDTRQQPGTPKARFAYLFPNRDSALISIRLRPDLSERRARRGPCALIREAVYDTTPRKACNDKPCFALERRPLRGQRRPGGHRRGCGQAADAPCWSSSRPRSW